MRSNPVPSKMARRVAILALALGLTAPIASLWACGPYGAFPHLFSSDPAQVAQASETLRRQGPAGLERLFALRAALEASQQAATTDEQRQAIQEKLAQLDRAADLVGGARYCSVSRLYWHTNAEAALRAAQAEGKPVLSLRMLGKLTDELSCANSRFFRTTLYANAEISRYLRENFILHWESIRPVPVITIDFGDGRRIERTITGNSAHYVLAADGRPLEALPGLYGPKPFLEWLKRSSALARLHASASPDQREWLLRKYHTAQHEAIARLWQADLAKVAPDKLAATAPTAGTQAREANAGPAAQAPPAGRAAPLAMTKAIIEAPLLVAMDYSLESLVSNTDDALWNQIAQLHAEGSRLDEHSTAIVARENRPTAARAAQRAITKARIEDPLLKMITQLEHSLALDSVRNEYLLHAKVHEWFAKGEASANIAELNERVYAELFLTPSSDPWLGLAQPDHYTALDRGGVYEPSP